MHWRTWNLQLAITVITRSVLKSNTYAWRFAMWPLKRAFCLGWKEWHHLRSVPQTAPVRWAIAHMFWKSPRPGPDSHFLAASLAPAARFGTISPEISTLQPQLFKYCSTFGLHPLYILFLAITCFTKGEMHVIDNQRKKIPKVTFMNRDIWLAYLVGFLQHPVVFSNALTTRG